MSDKNYFDYAATTPLREEVRAAMEPFLLSEFGNPSSIHVWGQKAENAVERSRDIVARYINADPSEIIFTSCGSESNNLALRGIGLARKFNHGANQLVTTKVEHHAISRTVTQLDKFFGFIAQWARVEPNGAVNLESFANLTNENTAIASIMAANNEIGTISPIQQLAEICSEKGVPFHTDAVQAAGYLPLDVQKTPVTAISLGSHKFYGPKGVGALYLRKGTMIVPNQTGGGQEHCLRAGTHNVPYIVGFAKAIELLSTERQSRVERVVDLRDRLIKGILATIPYTKLTGDPVDRLPNHASFVFKNVDGNLLLGMLDQAGYACSSGSACKTGNPEPSEVLVEIGLEREWSLGSLRLTLGESTTETMVNDLIQILPTLVSKNRQLRGK